MKTGLNPGVASKTAISVKKLYFVLKATRRRLIHLKMKRWNEIDLIRIDPKANLVKIYQWYGHTIHQHFGASPDEFNDWPR